MLKTKQSKRYTSQNTSFLNTNITQNQFRSNSTNQLYLKDVYNKVLPKIKSKKSCYDSKLTEPNLKSSYASTFYSTNEPNQKVITENINKKTKKNNIFKYVMFKEKLLLKKKKKLEINPNYFSFKQKNKKDIDLFIQEDYENMKLNKENDYSNLIKKLDRWDEDNCLVKNNDKISLYNILNKFYKKKNMTKELKNLNTMESLLKSKTNYDKLLKDHLEYKSSKKTTEVLSPNKNSEYIYSQSPTYKQTNNMSNKKPLNKFKFEVDDLKLLSEKIKYETQLHNDLIFVNSILYNKKLLKAEKSKRLEELYKARAELKQAYDKNYNHNMKDYWNRYEEYEQRYKKLENLINNQNKKEIEKISESPEKEEKEEKKEKEKKEEIKEVNEDEDVNNKDKEKEEENELNNEEKELMDKINTSYEKKEKSSKQVNKQLIYDSPSPRKNRKHIAPGTDIKRTFIKKYSSSQIKFMKEMNFIKATKINSINFEMKTKIEKLRVEYQNKIHEINELQVTLEEEIQITKNEINYYKQVNEELIREYRNYYLKILKKGNDHRKEGLVWVVKNLLELQINLEYQHFPKYLTHEHIDYLIELAHLLLEQSELIIIIKVLRKKQTTSYLDENLQAYNMLDKYMEEHLKAKTNRRSILGDLNNIYGKNMQGIIEEIDKKFEKVYKNNKEIVKNYLEKNEEEVKLRNALEHIKKGLYNSDKFIKENQASILDAFIGNSKNKDFFSFILKIRNRLNQLEVIITNLIKKEKDFYIEQIEKYNSATKNFDINFYKDVIKKSLFGEKFEFYE